MLKALIKLANQLDKRGLYKEANILDQIIKTAESRAQEDLETINDAGLKYANIENFNRRNIDYIVVRFKPGAPISVEETYKRAFKQIPKQQLETANKNAFADEIRFVISYIPDSEYIRPYVFFELEGKQVGSINVGYSVGKTYLKHFIKSMQNVDNLIGEYYDEKPPYTSKEKPDEPTDIKKYIDIPEDYEYGGGMDLSNTVSEYIDIPYSSEKQSRVLVSLIKLANKLDKRGLYKEANILDQIIKSAIDNPEPEPWELEMMQMDISPEAREKEKAYKKREVPTDPAEFDDMQKPHPKYNVDYELLAKMRHLLNKLEDPDDALEKYDWSVEKDTDYDDPEDYANDVKVEVGEPIIEPGQVSLEVGKPEVGMEIKPMPFTIQKSPVVLDPMTVKVKDKK